MANSGFAGNKRCIKKILLWTLLAVQICLIICFWCMQTDYSDHRIIDKNGQIFNKKVVGSIANMAKLKALPYNKALPLWEGRVNFVTRRKQNVNKNQQKELQTKKLSTFQNVSNFTRDFVEVKTYRLMNITGIEAEMTNDYAMDAVPNIWCFRRGTLDDGNVSKIFWNTDTQLPQCKCIQHWHGKDCSQNEVIYRALMLPRNQFILRQPIKEQSAHLLIYILEGYFCSLDFLELQIKTMADVADHFLILWRGYQQQNANVLKRKLAELLQTSRFTLYQCSSKSDCSQIDAFLYFRAELDIKFGKRLQSTDLLLYTNENVLISTDALRFFKYFAPAHLAPWRFRLKYNVYGFFWQHPEKTYLDGFLSSFGHLKEPDRLVKLLSNSNMHNGFRIIGDLNHFGGWYCEYCAHPDEIIAALNQTPDNVFPTAFETVQKDRDNFIQVPKNSRNNLVIDSKYLEYLIAQGLHIDGRTHLQKVRMNTDAYYAPIYAEKLKWKFGNLLTNLFEAIENDYVLDEAEGGFGF